MHYLANVCAYDRISVSTAFYFPGVIDVDPLWKFCAFSSIRGYYDPPRALTKVTALVDHRPPVITAQSIVAGPSLASKTPDPIIVPAPSAPSSLTSLSSDYGPAIDPPAQ